MDWFDRMKTAFWFTFGVLVLVTALDSGLNLAGKLDWIEYISAVWW
jgi:hypothetical protein